MKLWMWLSALAVAVIVGTAGFYLHQQSLEITGFVVLLLAIGIFLWSSLQLSLRVRPPTRQAEDTAEQDGAFPGYWPNQYKSPESLSSGTYESSAWDENRSLPKDTSLGE